MIRLLTMPTLTAAVLRMSAPTCSTSPPMKARPNSMKVITPLAIVERRVPPAMLTVRTSNAARAIIATPRPIFSMAKPERR